MQGLRTCPKALIPESRENHNIANGQKTNHLTASIMQISVVIFRVRPPIFRCHQGEASTRDCPRYVSAPQGAGTVRASSASILQNEPGGPNFRSTRLLTVRARAFNPTAAGSTPDRRANVFANAQRKTTMT
jgi:hypothetical protein